MNTHLSTCPVVGCKAMNLWQRVTVGGRLEMAGFTKNVLWLRESEAQVVLRHDGVLVDTKVTFNDWSGFLTSVEGAVREAEEIEKRLHIASSDKLTVEVDVVIRDVPVLDDRSPNGVEWNSGHPDRRRYVIIPTGLNDGPWFISDKAETIIVDGQEEAGGFPCLEAVVVASREALYSSHNRKLGLEALVTWIEPALWIREQREIAEKLAKEVLAP